ncbi:hypothetical protein BVC80_1737g13 [Macleaya cordata]|uniref:Uncharacterized protein n=1 Tax=Macleaya cordata TaxID=56857 RepID=A0A200Q896_MACCD|nr:hypothetical protein BVC80_1737g13 [Macleaya cordata]
MSLSLCPLVLGGEDGSDGVVVVGSSICGVGRKVYIMQITTALQQWKKKITVVAMNRRVRSVCKSSPKREEGYYRYLKPGALAQLRDSRISAKSQRTDLQIQIRVASSISSSTGINNIQNQISSIEGFPCFSGRIYSPRCPQRKKLVASRSFFFITSSPSSPVSDSPDSLMDIINTDLLVSH